jgi:malate dehydrogenase (oxaloacetate-decarboxylating)
MTMKQPSIAYSITVRAEYPNRVGMLGEITSAIGQAGGDIGAIDTVSSSRRGMIRDITINTRDSTHGEAIVKRLKSIPEIRVMSVSDPIFLRHLGGKIEVKSKTPVKTRNDMSIVYTPGVARVSMAIHHDPSAVWTLTGKGNSVAIVTDGSAVLGLGNIGPAAALPVMEGKAVLFKEMADVDAWPLCLDTNDPDEIIQTVKNISVGFGGINLEDISAPRCFYIEQRLKDELDIPVFHDDQHGTAVVLLAALINALKITGKRMEDLKVVVNGVGAGGIACGKMLLTAGVTNIIGCDRQGIIYRGADYGDNTAQEAFAEITNPDNIQGDLDAALANADVFLGLSGPNVLTPALVSLMNTDPIVFAMANPDPEIWPEEVEGMVRVMATGRSDYPNQINNALCFPGMFRGALDVRAREINEEMKLAAAYAIASGVPNSDLNEDFIVPSIFDLGVVRKVAREVASAAHRTGVARRIKKRLGPFSFAKSS